MIRLIREFLLRHHPAQRVDAIGDDQSLLLAGLLDSTLMLDLVSHLEKSLGIKIGDDDLIPENFESISAIQRYLQSRGRADS
ncbi:MAG: acyl carrier protein [Planctomycetaceae bacterium]